MKKNKRKIILWDSPKGFPLATKMGFLVLALSLIHLEVRAQNGNRKPGKLNDSLRQKKDSISHRHKPNSIHLGEVTVTASKFPKSISESGKVVDLISREELAESQGKSLAEVLNEVPGISIDALHSNPGLAPKTIFTQGASGDYTLIVLDGVPVSDPSSLGSNFDIRLVNPDQFERIEILKGGQSTLYGSDAVAGVVNLISKKPLEKGLNVSGTFTGGSYGTFKENLSLNHKIDSTLAYSAGYTHYKTNGLVEAVDNGTDSAHTGHFHKDGMVADNLYLSGNWNPGKWRISPQIQYASLSGQFSGGAFLDGINPYYSKSLVTGFSGRYSLEKGNIYFNEGLTYSKRYYGGPYPSGYTGRFNQTEVYYDQKLGAYLQLLGGLNYQTSQVLDTSSASLRINPSLSILSPYLSLFLNQYHGFNFSMGGRFNHNSSYGNNFTYNINPSWTWKATNLKLFADYATSFRAPKLPELYGEYGANPGLKPETSQSLEAGISGNISVFHLDDQAFRFRALGFYRNIQNAIVYLYPQGYLNQDEQRDQGLEFSSGLKISPVWELQASLALVTGKVKTKSILSGLDTVFNNLLRRPKTSFHARLHYHPVRTLNISLEFSSYSDRFDEDFTTGNYIPLANYQLLDAHIQYQADRKGRVHIFAQLGNILNKTYTEIIGYNTMKFNFNTGIQVAL